MGSQGTPNPWENVIGTFAKRLDVLEAATNGLADICVAVSC